MRRLSMLRAWLVALIAVLTACALPLAQARAATCKRAAALVVDGARNAEEPSTDAADAPLTQDGSEAPSTVPDATDCPTVVALQVAAASGLAPPLEALAESPPVERTIPRSIASGLERPPRRA